MSYVPTSYAPSAMAVAAPSPGPGSMTAGQKVDAVIGAVSSLARVFHQVHSEVDAAKAAHAATAAASSAASRP